ncbi:hypothetical protein IQ241_09420 [Romeria aff. gracilis LEGE 07310]|uniref:Uncharacterized protein n=1 Tax=Vasconcelosia minhoensis LEGE 07310 TaxID=915328 RepID=A0A8J7A7H3_9CYAN|nr:hypothetical protein [Romeria gracilis]MBE9077515.1 hypothetical protein [Romeria aff. gracilis LEGE 07310]
MLHAYFHYRLARSTRFHTWGDFQRRTHGVLLGTVGAGISKTIFGLGQMLLVWIPAQFCSSLNFPLKGRSSTAIWLAKVALEVQGRVFAARQMSLLAVSLIATAIAPRRHRRYVSVALSSRSPALGVTQQVWSFGSPDFPQARVTWPATAAPTLSSASLVRSGPGLSNGSWPPVGLSASDGLQPLLPLSRQVEQPAQRR